MTTTDLHSDIEFKKLVGSGYSVLSKNCSSKQKPGLDICCHECGKYFRFKWQLNEHSRIHENKIHLKCHQCSSTFIRVGDLNKHLRVHSTERPFKCNFCCKYFKSKPTKVCHEDTHNLNTYSCRFCGETFNRYYLKIKHERTHRQAEIIKGENGILKFKCIFCNGVFASHEFLEEHIQKAHKRKSSSNNRKIKPKIYKCSVCSQKFYTYKEHRNHIMDMHPDKFKNIFFETCKLCLKKVSSSFLPYHMNAHEGVKPHICMQCNAKFARKGELNKHMVVHNESKIYQCTWCAVILKTKLDFESHKLQHFGRKRFKCDECEATYHTSSNLQQHKRRWHIRNFAICTICQKKVLTMDLNRHMKINHESNEKLCDHCGITFLNEFKLKKHLNHLQNTTKAENMDKVSHPYYRYEGSNELPFNSISKPKNHSNKTKKYNYHTKNISNIFKCKNSESFFKINMFIGECSICGFTSCSRLGLKYHLQNQKFKLRLWGIEDQRDKKEPIIETKSTIIIENNFESKNYFTSLSEVIKHSVKGSIIIVKPTKEVSWILSHNLLTNSINGNEKNINFKKLKQKNLSYSCHLTKPLHTVLQTVQPLLNNYIPSVPSDIKSYYCQTCTKSNSVPNVNNGKNDTIIFKCIHCRTFNHYKNSVTKVPSEVSALNKKLCCSTLIPNINKSILTGTIAGPIYLMGPLLSVEVPKTMVPVQISKCMPVTEEPSIPVNRTANSALSLQNIPSQFTVQNTSIGVKGKKVIRQQNASEFAILNDKSKNNAAKIYLSNLELSSTRNPTDKILSKQLSISSDDKSKSNSEESHISNCELSTIANLTEKVPDARIQEITMKRELAAIKGKQVLSIEELEKLRGCDVDTLLNYLQN